MDHDFYFTAGKIRHRIALLEKNLFRKAEPLPSWYYHEIDQVIIDPAQIPHDTCPGWLEIKPHSYL